MGNADAAPGLSIAWRKGIGMASKEGQLITSPLVAADGKVFTMDAQAGVQAHNAQPGALVWRINLRPHDNRRDREGFGGGLAYADGKLFMTSGFRLVAQLDAATGRVGWRVRTEQPIHGAPTVSGGRVMAVAIDNTLLTYDAGTGAPGWTPRSPATRSWPRSARASWSRCAPPTVTTCGTTRSRAPAAPVRSPRFATSRAVR